MLDIPALIMVGRGMSLETVGVMAETCGMDAHVMVQAAAALADIVVTVGMAV
jgi:hypothetical protein